MIRFPKKYTMIIDEQVQAMAIKDISTFGADEFVTKAYVRLQLARWYALHKLRLLTSWRCY